MATRDTGGGLYLWVTALKRMGLDRMGVTWPGTEPVISLSPPITPQEKLKYFPIRVNTKLEPEAEAEEGLGGLPSNITSVSSLLLFNTTENLYVQSGGTL